MSNLYQKEGRVIDWDNDTGSAVAVDDLVAVGFDRVGVAIEAIASGSIGSVVVEGVVRLAKAAVAIVADDKIYGSLGATEAVTNVVAATLYFIGYAEADAASGDSFVNVRLAPFREEGPRYLVAAATPTALGIGDFMSGSCTVEGTVNGAQTVTIPAIASLPAGSVFTIINNGSANARTIDPNASEAIGVPGATSTTHTACDAVGDAASFVSNGTAWYTLWTRIS